MRFVMEKIQEAYFIHLWSDAKETGKISVKSRAAFSVLANKYCPKVTKVLKEI